MGYTEHWLWTLGAGYLLGVVGFVLRFLIRREARKHPTPNEKAPGHI
jgi:hypothetical protein